MRYYHYLSSNKIEMLYQQMAEYKPKVTTDIGLDLKVFKGGRKSERSETEPNVYGKLLLRAGSMSTSQSDLLMSQVCGSMAANFLVSARTHDALRSRR